VRLRADEVRVASAGKAGQFPAVDRLSGRRLIYLGEANSKAMLYDPLRRVTFLCLLQFSCLSYEDVDYPVSASPSNRN
jgi:hypothetical protein